MLQQFLKNLSYIIDIPSSKSYLLAVSGGVDSMALVNLFEAAKLNFSIEERYYLKNRESIDGSNGDTPFFNFKFGLGNKIKLRPNTYLFIETTAETVRGKWFGVDHSIEEFSTAMGLGISF